MTYEWRHLQAREIDHERLWLSVAIACGVLLALGQVSSQFVLQVPQCMLKLITGLPCPTCGGTRALKALLGRGDVLAALRWNPLVTIGALAAMPFLAYAAIVTVFHGRRVRVLIAEADKQLLRNAAWIAILANWMFLIVDGR